MAWTKETRAKAALSRKAKGTTNQYAKAKLEGRVVEISDETRRKMGEKSIGRIHSDQTRKLISEKARKSTHRRLVKSTRPYVKTDGTEVLLDSSWEEALARRLDELQIEWIRPVMPMKWVDSVGRQRNYFPDFWLPQFKIFLDPKNPAAFTQQKEKVAWLQQNRADVRFILTLAECINFSLP